MQCCSWVLLFCTLVASITWECIRTMWACMGLGVFIAVSNNATKLRLSTEHCQGSTSGVESVKCCVRVSHVCKLFIHLSNSCQCSLRQTKCTYDHLVLGSSSLLNFPAHLVTCTYATHTCMFTQLHMPTFYSRHLWHNWIVGTSWGSVWNNDWGIGHCRSRSTHNTSKLQKLG